MSIFENIPTDGECVSDTKIIPFDYVEEIVGIDGVSVCYDRAHTKQVIEKLLCTDSPKMADYADGVQHIREHYGIGTDHAPMLFSDIAEKYSCSPATVQNQCVRAVDELRRLLKTDKYDIL